MLSCVGILQFVIFLFSGLTVLSGLFLLLHPIGSNLPGDGQNSSALTAAIALIVVVIGLMLTVYMQSAEYRREAEIIDGPQEIRIVLTIMAARVNLARVGQEEDQQISAEEREVLMKDKEARAQNLPTRWRTVPELLHHRLHHRYRPGRAQHYQPSGGGGQYPGEGHQEVCFEGYLRQTHRRNPFA